MAKKSRPDSGQENGAHDAWSQYWVHALCFPRDPSISVLDPEPTDWIVKPIISMSSHGFAPCMWKVYSSSCELAAGPALPRPAVMDPTPPWRRTVVAESPPWMEQSVARLEQRTVGVRPVRRQSDAVWWQPQNIDGGPDILLKAAFASKEPVSSAILEALKVRRKRGTSSSSTL